MTRLPISAPSISEREHAYVLAAMRSGQISGSGPFVEQFEAGWAARCGVEHAVAVSSGTAALHLLLLAHSVTPGDEVIVPSLTYAAVANAVRHTGAVPVVVDVDPASWCLAPKMLAAAITARTVGVIAVHAYGHPAPMGAIVDSASRHGLWVIEDGAEAHLARCADAAVGGLADGGAFSFYGNKILTTGEGGAVTLRDTSTAARVRALRHQGIRAGHDHRYVPSLTGHSFRMSNLAAAVGCAQLTRVDELIARRQALVDRYREVLTSSPDVALQPIAPWAKPAPWLFSLLIEHGSRGWDRDQVAHHLHHNGIETRPLFPPLDTLAAASPARSECPAAHLLARQGLSLPLFADMRPEDVDRVTTRLLEYLGSPDHGRPRPPAAPSKKAERTGR